MPSDSRGLVRSPSEDDIRRASFVDAGPGIAILDLEGRIVDANPSLEAILGTEGAELYGTSLANHLDPPEDLLDAETLDELSAGPRRLVSLERRARRAGGGLFWAGISVSFAHSLEGGGLVVLVDDITRRKLAHQALAEERELLNRVVRNSADASVLVDMSESIIEWNPAAERLFGWKREEIIGRPLSTLVPRHVRLHGRKLLEQERAGEIIKVVVPRLRKNGTIFEAELTASGVRDPDGRIIGYVGSYRDVTQRLLIETASSAVASDLDPMAALTRFGEVLGEVVPFCQLSLSVIEGDSYRRLVSIGSRPHEFSANERLPLEGNSVKRAVDTLAPVVVDDTLAGRWPFDKELARRGVGSYVVLPFVEDGRAFATFSIGFPEPGVPTDSMVSLLRSVASGVVQGVKNILLYERQRETVERLRALDDMKNSFLQAVSHELRTPLTAVLGLSLTMERQEGSLSEEAKREIIGMVASNARKLDRLLSDLLDLDRLTRGALEPHFRPVNLGVLAVQMVKEVDLDGRELNVDVERVQIEADGPKLERVVENLLVNAIRHTPPGSRLWVQVRSHPEGALLAVEDDGPGVPDDRKDAVFELFRQGDQPVAGTGVGLTLVARFAELHGGRAWVEDRPGGGASFRVLLPYRR